jgi:SAM-dependent methyltransferase
MNTELPRIFDRDLYLKRRARASASGPTLIDQRMSEDLSDRLSIVTRHFEKVLLLSDSPIPMSQALQHSGKVTGVECRPPPPDEDLKVPEQAYNAIFSLLDLHAVNDVPGYLAQLSRALLPDGLLMLAFFAGDTLHELRESWLAAEAAILGGASPRVAPMISVRELGGLLQRAGLALPVADLDKTTVRYADPFALIYEIKTLGFANPLIGRSTRMTSRRLLQRAAEHYQQNFSDADGRIRATIEVAWANSWKPHASQPQPLKPGTAKSRLADALKVSERKL